MHGFDLRNTRRNPLERRLAPSSASRLRPAWDFYLPCSTYSTPAVVDGVLYTGDYCSSAYALDAKTGALLWEQYIDGVTGSPAVANGRVFLGSRHAPAFQALSATTGAVLWSTPTDGLFFYSAVVHDGLVFAGTETGHFYAFDESSGAVVWEQVLGNLHLNPTLAEGVLYLTVRGADLSLYALDELGGQVLWQVTVDPVVGGQPQASVEGGRVYIGGERFHALDAATGAPIWSTDVGAPLHFGQALADTQGGTVICVGSSDGRFHGLDASTGAIRWTTAVGSELSSPSVANGVVIAVDFFGPQYAYAFNAASGALLWLEPVGGLPYPTHAGPSIVDGMVYLPVTFDYRIAAYRAP
jgi:outer membrane protein assembly factor BamB